MLLSGEQIVIKTNDYEAKIGTIGASLSMLKYKGHDIALSFEEDTVPLAHLNKILIPWPNRVYKGEYKLNGNEYHLWVNDYKNNCAIHGLCAFEFWNVKEKTQNSVTFHHLIGARECYPFVLECTVVYTLTDQDGLDVKITVKNLSKTSAPIGIGSHPYLTCDNQVIDECEVSGTKLIQLKYDSEFMLSGDDVNPEANAFADGFAQVGNMKIDNCFMLEGKPTCKEWSFKLKSNKHKLVSILSSNTPYLQLFTAEKLNRTGFAVEPMTCGVNAFNQADASTLLVAPNECKEMQYSIRGELID